MSDASTRRKHLIYTSFRAIVGEEQAQLAVTLWERDFASKPTFSPMRFLRATQDVMGLSPATLKTLMHRFSENQTLERRAKDTPPEHPTFSSSDAFVVTSQVDAPPPSGAVSVPDTYSPVPKRPARQVVFTFVLSRLVTALRQHRGFLMTQLARTRLSQGARLTLEEWLSTPTRNQPPTAELTQREMTEILDALYGWCCDLVGPVVTDKLFDQVITQAQGLPEAAAFPPRSLL